MRSPLLVDLSPVEPPMSRPLVKLPEHFVPKRHQPQPPLHIRLASKQWSFHRLKRKRFHRNPWL
jgi:hypothetical protein